MLALVSLLSGVGAALTRWFVLLQVWGWYLVPLGAPPLTFAQVVVLSSLATLVTPALDVEIRVRGLHNKILSDDEKVLDSIATNIAKAIIYAIVLLMAWALQ